MELGVRYLLGVALEKRVGLSMDMEARRQQDMQILDDETLMDRLIHIDRLSLLGEMASGFAHEVNQPLTAIATYARAASRMLTNGALDAKKLSEILDAISEQALRAGESISRLRSLTPAVASIRSAVNCNAAIRDVIDLLKPELNRARIVATLELLESLPDVDADPLHIRHVLVNLLRNAIDAQRHSLGDRQVRVSTAIRGNIDVAITIWNAGESIPEPDAQRLFQPFFSTKPYGTGLGLNISRSLVRAHGGDLQYERHSGPGATFRITLPRK